MKNYLKKIIPKSMFLLIKKYVISVNSIIYKICASNRAFSVLYYVFLSRSFYRECQSVISGKSAYYSSLKNNNDFEFLLRRNIHRIEKGLIMIPRRPVFARDYIVETVEAFRDFSNQQSKSNLSQEYFWYKDVLDEYFLAVDNSDSTVKKAKLIYSQSNNNNESNQVKRKPYVRDFKNKITYDDMYELSRQRRSVRWFEQRKVDRDLLDKAFLVANQSPSACNRQPFEFLVYDDAEMVKKISNCSIGMTGFKENVPGIIVLKGNLSAYFSERDRHIIYIDGGLAAMSFMFALETLGLSSCPINWPDVEKNEKKLANLLGLDKYERPIMLIAYGYPNKDALVPYSEKKSLNNIRSYDYTN